MIEENNLQERFLKVLHVKGSDVLIEVRRILLEDIHIEDLKAPLRYLSERCNDTLRPALIKLSCEAVGGQFNEKTLSVAKAMTLLSLSLGIYDDVIDKSRFSQTLLGKYGEGLAIITSGVVTVKGFSHLRILGDDGVSQRIERVIEDSLLKMAGVEAKNLRLKGSRVSSEEELQLLRTRASNIEACLKIGAIFGGGSDIEVEKLGEYGSHFGTMLELYDDVVEVLNFNLELADKIRKKSLPYPLTWARDHSSEGYELLSTMMKKEIIEPIDIKSIVEMLFDTGTLLHIENLSKMLSTSAVKELQSFRDCEATRLLRFLVEAQHELILKNFRS